MKKKCKRCNTFKSYSEFGKRKPNKKSGHLYKDGLDSWCKQCYKDKYKHNKNILADTIIIDKIRRNHGLMAKDITPEMIIKERKKEAKRVEVVKLLNNWKFETKKGCSRCFVIYSNKTINFQKDSSKKDKLSSICKKCSRLQKVKYYYKNKEKLINDVQLWVDANRDKRRANASRYNNSLKLKYPVWYRVKGLINTVFRKSLKGKIKPIIEYGIDVNEIVDDLKNKALKLKLPIEEVIKDYHIDHIIPVSCYNLNSENEIKRLSNAKNLRWLLARENMSRGNKLRPQDIEVINTLPKHIYPKSWNGNIPIVQ
tara:strand:+ start:80 stop:1015 length:936 start_codon:yes stop_codon:yes gene_type:complete